jgi:hypothetical protein
MVKTRDRLDSASVPAPVSALFARILDQPKGVGQRTPVSLPGAENYSRLLRSVSGWFMLTDFHLFDFVLGRQLREGITGDLLEIGAYQGKSAVLLGYGLRDDEVLVVCDLFGTDPTGVEVPSEGMEVYLGLTVERFYLNYDRFHNRRPQVEVCASTELGPRIEGRRFRFLHIDGGHAYECVKSDIELAKAHATGGAVVVFDDYRSPHTPGVAAAVWEAAAEGVVYPFCISEGKLYAAFSKEDQQRWSEAAQTFGADNSGWEMEIYSVRDLELVRLQYITRHIIGSVRLRKSSTEF